MKLNEVDLLAIQYALTNEISRLEKGKENEYNEMADTVNYIIETHRDALGKIIQIYGERGGLTC